VSESATPSSDAPSAVTALAGPGAALELAPRSKLREKCPNTWKKLDALRVQLWHERRRSGMRPLEAWLAIITDQDVGYRDFRGARAVDAGTLARTLTKFLKRACPEAVEGAQNMARMEASALTSRMVHIVEDVAEGRVAETALANAQHAAARTMLQISGVLQNGSAGTGKSVAVQINNTVSGSDHDLSARLSRDPEAQRAAIDAARRITPQVRDSAES